LRAIKPNAKQKVHIIAYEALHMNLWFLSS